jgi:hypothetical protein
MSWYITLLTDVTVVVGPAFGKELPTGVSGPRIAKSAPLRVDADMFNVT